MFRSVVVDDKIVPDAGTFNVVVTDAEVRVPIVFSDLITKHRLHTVDLFFGFFFVFPTELVAMGMDVLGWSRPDAEREKERLLTLLKTCLPDYYYPEMPLAVIYPVNSPSWWLWPPKKSD